MKKFAVIPGKGLGDLMIMLAFIKSLSTKYKVQIYHPLIQRLHYLIPYVEAFDRPHNLQDMALDGVKECVITYENTPYFEHIYPELQTHFNDRLKVINPCVTDKKDYPFVENFFFDIKKSFTENLLDFAKIYYLNEPLIKVSGLKKCLVKNPKLVVIHATASKASKSWPARRFLKLKCDLEKMGYTVTFATMSYEEAAIAQGLYSGLKSLEELIDLVSQSAIVIGNESGVCHLASALGVPSIVLCRNHRIQRFWGADYEGKTYPLYPPKWMINVKNCRLRDRLWQHLIFKSCVLKKALGILQNTL